MDKIRIILGALIFFSSSTVNAALIGNQDWLQVSNTLGNSWADFALVFDPITGKCKDISSCTLDGSINLSGYIWASAFEVDQMLSSFSDGLTSSDYSDDLEIVLGKGYLDSLTDFFTPTLVQGGFIKRSGVLGFVRDSIDNNASAVLAWDYADNDSYLDTALLEIHYTKDRTESWIGGFLYKASIPEPSILALMLTGLIALGITLRKRLIC